MEKEERQTELQQFKQFLNNHPLLIRKIRKDGKSWQEVYEQWVLLGEEDTHWEQFKQAETLDSTHEENDEEKKDSKMEFNKDTLKQILKYTESMDMEKLQHQVQQLSGTVSAIQEVVQQFQGTKRSTSTRQEHPFQWFRD